MENKISVLKQTELLGRQFNVYGSVEEPLFLAKDIASFIEHSNTSKMLDSVDDDEKTTLTISYNGGMTTNQLFVTEDGLYEVLMLSRKPVAKQFKKGVKTILKEIRTKGGYITTKEDDTPELIMARALIVANATIERVERERKELEAQNQRLIHSNKTYTTSELAKELNLKSAIELNRILAEKKIQFKQNKTWLLYAKYADMGYTSIKQITLDSGRIEYDRRWTGLGRNFIINLLSV